MIHHSDHSSSLIPYDKWIDNANRNIIMNALELARDEGLPGKHHFYINFRTDAPGVDIPDRIKKQYPHEITIVLQHQFSDLIINRQKKVFSVKLSFGGIPTKLTIPLKALISFADPAAEMIFQFWYNEDAIEEEFESEQETDTKGKIISLAKFRKNISPDDPS